MANKIETTNFVNSTFVDSQSRYRNAKIFYYGEPKFITFETYKRPVSTESPDDRFYLITKGTEYRPDLVSQRAYGTPNLWWKIMEVNKIYDVFNFRAGLNIRIPSVLE